MNINQVAAALDMRPEVATPAQANYVRRLRDNFDVRTPEYKALDAKLQCMMKYVTLDLRVALP